LPNASVAVTFTAGAIATPATTAEGCVVNASDAAAAGETVNAVLVAASRPLEAVSVLLPTRFTLSAAKVAVPVASVAIARAAGQRADARHGDRDRDARDGVAERVASRDGDRRRDRDAGERRRRAAS
jgi:hypothetical protein